MKNILLSLLTLSLVVSLAACNADISANDYQSQNANVVSKVVPGVVLSKRVVNVKTDTGVGKIAGGLAGGIIGSGIGGGRGAALGLVAGAVAGGVLGQHLEDEVNTQKAFEYIVKLDNNKSIAITQGMDTNLSVGQRILLIYGARSRLIPDNTPANDTRMHPSTGEEGSVSVQGPHPSTGREPSNVKRLHPSTGDYSAAAPAQQSAAAKA